MSQSLEHLSERPWSEYTAADYTVEQWHSACLIHQHEGPPTSKGQCKLPVKTPNGAVNRNGVHSAAAALAGARGGVHASSDEKISAARALVRLYHQMDEEPPASLLGHSNIVEYLEHVGVKGMKWGVRKASNKPKAASEARKAHELKKKPASQLTNKQLKAVNERLNLESNYRRLNPSKVQKGHNAVKGFLAGAGTVTSLVALANTPTGKAAINAVQTMIRGPRGQLRLPGI